MKRAGEILSVFFNKNLAEKAQGYSDLFSCWEEITKKSGISSVAPHSRIVELERAILLVETDHPGWIQILQTKQTCLLSTIIRRFPDLEIRGISFFLSRDPFSFSSHFRQDEKIFIPPSSDANFFEQNAEKTLNQNEPREYFNRIENKEFLKTLKRLKKLENRKRS
jgi:hypothetical protein